MEDKILYCNDLAVLVNNNMPKTIDERLHLISSVIESDDVFFDRMAAHGFEDFAAFPELYKDEEPRVQKEISKITYDIIEEFWLEAIDFDKNTLYTIKDIQRYAKLLEEELAREALIDSKFKEELVAKQTALPEDIQYEYDCKIPDKNSGLSGILIERIWSTDTDTQDNQKKIDQLLKYIESKDFMVAHHYYDKQNHTKLDKLFLKDEAIATNNAGVYICSSQEDSRNLINSEWGNSKIRDIENVKWEKVALKIDEIEQYIRHYIQELAEKKVLSPTEIVEIADFYISNLDKHLSEQDISTKLLKEMIRDGFSDIKINTICTCCQDNPVIAKLPKLIKSPEIKEFKAARESAGKKQQHQR